ncbi:unnamed protein product [Moneuplotes crassus]|uniref:SMC hinge domain-containing protein n=1 Tax=Euplotes crassus TaxID=5936 RepID=A0AAD1UHH0_EUPCR|nr:unnamed protein product [Moneuplotes crassus]
MFVRKVEVKGFRSYKKLENQQFEFCPDINLIIGLNGSGKSNLLSSLSFMFDDRLSKLALDEKTRIAHQDGDNTSDVISVSVEFDNHQKLIPIGQDTITLKRELNIQNGKDSYFLGNDLILKSDLHSFFGFTGVLFNDMCRSIHQGKIQEIANLDESGLLEVLLDYSGATQLKNRLQTLRNSLTICSTKKDEIERFKGVVVSKLNLIAEKVSDFETLQKLSTEKYSLEYLQLKKRGEKLKGEITRNQESKNDIMNAVNADKSEKNEILASYQSYITEIRQLKSKIQANKDKETMYQHYSDSKNMDQLSILDKENRVENFKSDYEKNIGDFHKSIPALEEELESIQKLIPEHEQEVSEKTKKFQEIQAKYLNAKESYELLQEELNHSAVKRSGFKNEKERKKFYTQEMSKLATEISMIERHLKKEVDAQEKLKEEIKIVGEQIEDETLQLEDKKKKLTQIEVNMDPSKKRDRNLKYVQSLNFSLDEKKIEQKENSEKILALEELIEGSDKNYKTIKRLMRKIEDEDISGFQGLFIDLIEIKDEIMYPVVETALKGKLFVLVVDTVRSANKIMELNKEIKGGVIQCFPLELIEQINDPKAQVPQGNDARPLLSRVSIKSGVDPRIGKLLDHFLGKVYLVSDLDTAFTMSDLYKVTSITPGLKIVYPGAFIAKTGSYDYSNKKIAHYYNLAELKSNEKDLKGAIFELEMNISNYKAKDLDYLKDNQQYLLSQRSLSREVHNHNMMIVEKNSRLSEFHTSLERSKNQVLTLEKQIEKHQESQAKLEKEMKGDSSSSDESDNTKELLKAIEKQRIILLDSGTKMGKANTELESIRNHLHNVLLKREKEVSHVLNEKQRQQANVEKKEQIENQRASSDDLRNMEEYAPKRMINAQEGLRLTRMEIEKDEETLDQIQAQAIEKAQEKDLIDNKIMEKLIDLEKLNVELRNLRERCAVEKLESLKQKADPARIKDNSLPEEKLEDLIKKKEKQIKEIEQKGNKSHMYGFYLRMKDQYEEVIKKVDHLDQVKSKITEILDESERSKTIAIQNSLKRLSKKFNEYFSFFVENADTSIKFIQAAGIMDSKEEEQNDDIEEVKTPREETKDSPEKSLDMKEESKILKDDAQDKKTQKSMESQANGVQIGDHMYTGLSVKVNFKEKARIQTLKELSGGEKTVVALCFLFALNSLTPSYVYLLDEVDSALDQMYRGGLNKLLSQITAAGTTQIFMTSFHEEIIKAADKIFKVDFKNCRSKIFECDRERAEMVLKEIKDSKREEQ